jgi:alpha-tubulin suppressor-like RCC1 family protein
LSVCFLLYVSVFVFLSVSVSYLCRVYLSIYLCTYIPTYSEQGSPVPMSIENDAYDVCAGHQYTCIVSGEAGQAKCTGKGLNGRTGNGDASDSNVLGPVVSTLLTAGVVRISCGLEHTCALLGGGGLACWGVHNTGQTGLGVVGTGNDKEPVSVLLSPSCL